MAARRSKADRCLSRRSAEQSAAHSRWSWRRLWRSRRHQPASAHVSARATHWPTSSHSLLARRKLSGPRASPPGSHLDASPRHPRWATRQGRSANGFRRRCICVHFVGGAHQRCHSRARSVPLPQRCRRRLRSAHEQPAVRSNARLRRCSGLLCSRRPDGQARGSVRHRPSRDSFTQRDGHRRQTHHRPDHRERCSGSALHSRDRSIAIARRTCRRPRSRPDAVAWRCWAHCRLGSHRARHRLRSSYQELDV